MILSVFYYIVLAFLLGLLIDLFLVDWKETFWGKLFLRLGFGTLMIPLVGVIFSLIRVPLHWVSFLAAALVVLGLFIWKKKPTLSNLLAPFVSLKENPKQLLQSYSILLVLVMFGVTLFMYTSGSFAYPWLENGDPYGYATAAKYISENQSYLNEFYFSHYAYPYAQGYQIVMGLLHQTNDSINWTLKFFNSLFISLSIPLFYFFVRRFTRQNKVALWSTFFLFAVPAWVSHFIFPLNFNMSLLIVFFYALFSLRESSRWKYLAALSYAALLVTHFYTSVVITALALLAYLSLVLATRDFHKDFLFSLVGGFGVSLLYWIPALITSLPLLERGAQLGGLDVFYPLLSFAQANVALFTVLIALIVGALVFFFRMSPAWFEKLRVRLTSRVARLIYGVGVLIYLLILFVPKEKLLYAAGSADRVYTLKDFFIAQHGNMINNPLGIGLIAMLFVVFGFLLLLVNQKKLFSSKQGYHLVLLSWLGFTFFGVLGVSLSIGFAPFRMWTFFALAASIVAGYGFVVLLETLSSLTRGNQKKLLVFGLAVLLVVGVYFTSFDQKYTHNTAIWPEHQVMLPDSQSLYASLLNDNIIPKDSRVVNICHGGELPFAFDMVTPVWDNPYFSNEHAYLHDAPLFYAEALNLSAQEVHASLQEADVDYAILGYSCVFKFDRDEQALQAQVAALVESDLFEPVYSSGSELLLSLVEDN